MRFSSLERFELREFGAANTTVTDGVLRRLSSLKNLRELIRTTKITDGK